MIKKISIAIVILISFSVADGYKTITRAKYKQMKEEPRIALVIGNKDYEQDSLRYPITDAKKIKDFLEDRNFHVIYEKNVQTKGALRKLINKFLNSIKKDGVGVFYFSGHGMSAYNKNYLIPIKNSSISDNEDIEDIGLSVNYLLTKLEKKKNRLNIVILDACRNNLDKGASSTFSGDSAKGVFIAYATAEGKRAKDNGLFASLFVKNAKIEGLSLEKVFKRVREQVNKITKQTPFTNSGIIGDFYFTLPNNFSKVEIKEEASSHSTLKIKTIPKNANIEILGEKYFDGIRLQNGKSYKVRVFKNGYITKGITIEMKNTTVLNITLNKEEVEFNKVRVVGFKTLLDEAKASKNRLERVKDEITSIITESINNIQYQIGNPRVKVNNKGTYAVSIPIKWEIDDNEIRKVFNKYNFIENDNGKPYDTNGIDGRHMKNGTMLHYCNTKPYERDKPEDFLNLILKKINKNEKYFYLGIHLHNKHKGYIILTSNYHSSYYVKDRHSYPSDTIYNIYIKDDINIIFKEIKEEELKNISNIKAEIIFGNPENIGVVSSTKFDR
jgi:hypothetical protein